MPLEGRELRGWPTAEVLDVLAELRTNAPTDSAVKIFLESTEGLDDSAFVESAYRSWLKREPDASGRRAYVEGLAVGSRVEVMESILNSDEFRLRPLWVAVVPDHRVFNAATLQYLAESERRPLRFWHALHSGDVARADAVIVKEGGDSGPWPESRPPDEVLASIAGTARDGSRHACPDGSFVRVLTLGT
jgi:hypothetical protein